MRYSLNMHWQRVTVVILLFALTITLALFREEAKLAIKSSFESGVIPIVIWIYVFVSVISKNIFFTNQGSSQFEIYTETIFSVASYGLAGTTSIALLQGVYLQNFYDKQFFFNFGSLDLASIGLVSSYLLIYCGVVTTRMLADVVFRVNAVDTEPRDTN